jgi:hypothetical protein
MSEAPSPPIMTPYTYLTYCIYVYTVHCTVYSWKKLEGQFFTKPAENTNMTDSISSLYKFY